MDEPMDELVVEVRAATNGFASDLAQMRGAFDSTLLDGFERAGSVLERGLAKAIRSGSLGFGELKRNAMQALDEIASRALQMGLDAIFGSSGGTGGAVGGLLTSLLGLPGRATGGPVSPGRGYVVGERGPELFVPTSAGRVEAGMPGQPSGRDVRVSIQLATPRGASAPTSLRRSSRQVASAVRRALQDS
ncbi:tail tape measure protein [Altererythrobacter arenosus]|uniref:Tail tape measure protein n=1 Tax=Altererythrobacter arenosus TaxID=3032592 RepID=A0ABY8FV09_9SPHN|nr:tail tape measure protein [Altererythrobacter sp. CAU 1644]WFL78836.1 tail tape measure protein [Altererythrobacter sp. CAU 1644]